MRWSAGLAAILACCALEPAALAAGTCSYTIQSTSGFHCPLSAGGTACVAMSSVTGACDRPLRCVGGLRTFTCDLSLVPKAGPTPQCPPGSARLERLALRCARAAVVGPIGGPTRTRTPTRTVTPTPTPTVAFPCPDPFASPTPGTPLPGFGNDAVTPGPCTSHESREAGTITGSIVILPKLVVGAGRDTVIQLTNRSNLPAAVRCVYLDGRLTDPTQPPGPLNRPLLTVTDFALHLTPQQPMQWTVGSGRQATGGATDPGAIPPLSTPFVGGITCLQVDDSGVPFPADALTAAATLLGPDGDVSKYDAFTLVGNADANNTDSVFALDDAEFSACPAELYFHTIPAGAPHPVLGAGASVSSRLTLMPCREDFAQPQFPLVPVLAESQDEFELRISAVFQVDGFLDIDLLDLGSAFLSLGESFRAVHLQVIGTPRCFGGANHAALCTIDAACAGGRCLPSSPLVGVIETTHRDAVGRSAHAAQTLQSCGANPNAAIALPPP